jgi:S-formylglutathione hydrolase FrmB
VSWADDNLRTIPSAAGRKLAGISMGGQGVINIALDHPGIFGKLYAHSPIFRVEANSPEYLFGRGAAYLAKSPYARMQAGNTPDAPVYVDMAIDDPINAENDRRAERVMQMLESRGKLAGKDVWNYGGHTDSHWRGLAGHYRSLHEGAM